MIKSLQIKNYALIEEMNLNFSSGFVTITGETGAGKSIILGALSLLLGQRSDTSVLTDADEKSVVEATFDLSNYTLQHIFEQHDVDYEDTTIIRREILKSGKSRSFVNDTPVTLQFLKELSAHLLDVHSQHANLLLSDNTFQIGILDILAENQELLAKFHNQYNTFKQLKNELSMLVAQVEKDRKEYDYNSHLFSELQQANLKENEMIGLEEELSLLSHTQEIEESLGRASMALNGDENLVAELKLLLQGFKNIESFYPRAKEFCDRLESACIELSDMGNELQILVSDIEADPERLSVIEDRIGLLLGLQKKHFVQTVNDLIIVRDDFKQKLQKVDDFEVELAELSKKIEEAEKITKEVCREISERRKKVSPEFEKEIIVLLQELGIPNAQFKVNILTQESFSEFGTDDISFLFSANKNAQLHKINEVASGGEMSRVMLCLKYVLSRFKKLPSIIFDEIDTGVSGEIADKMATLMLEMSKQMQVICITHLPQIASKGNMHFKVFKTDSELKTITKVKQVEEEERISEIAKMLSGKDITEAALQNAKEMLKK